jgi:hypothetical protein
MFQDQLPRRLVYALVSHLIEDLTTQLLLPPADGVRKLVIQRQEKEKAT